MLTTADFRRLQVDLEYHRDDTQKEYNKAIVPSPLSVSGNSVAVGGLINRYIEDHRSPNMKYDTINQVYDNSFAGTVNVAKQHLKDDGMVASFVGNPAIDYCTFLWEEMTHDDIVQSAKLLFLFNDEGTQRRLETDNLEKIGDAQREAHKQVVEFFDLYGYSRDCKAYAEMRPLIFLFTTLQYGFNINVDQSGMIRIGNRALNRWVVNKVSFDERVSKKVVKWENWMQMFQNLRGVIRLSEDPFEQMRQRIKTTYSFGETNFLYVKPPLDTRSPDATTFKPSDDRTNYYDTQGKRHYFTPNSLKGLLSWVDSVEDKVDLVLQYGILINKYGDNRLNESQRIIYDFIKSHKDMTCYHIDPMSYNKNTIGSNGLMHNKFVTDFFITNF